MTNKLFKPANYFDLTEFKWKKIFNGIKFVWEVIPRIKEFSQGKLIKGKKCQIAESALIREGVILGDNITVGHCVELKNCIIMNNTAVAHLNYVGDSVIGNNVNVSGGTILANFRLDQKPVEIKYRDERIKTNLAKFGAIVGDGTHIGVNAVLNPGTTLGKNCRVYPLTSVVGYHQRKSVLK